MFISVLHSEGNGSCNDDWKGDSECDEVNNKAECHYDYGDCCKTEWIGDGECDDRNNFIGCTNNTGTGQYTNDGGDCFPRECFVDKDDPLDGVYSCTY